MTKLEEYDLYGLCTSLNETFLKKDGVGLGFYFLMSSDYFMDNRYLKDYPQTNIPKDYKYHRTSQALIQTCIGHIMNNKCTFDKILKKNFSIDKRLFESLKCHIDNYITNLSAHEKYFL